MPKRLLLFTSIISILLSSCQLFNGNSLFTSVSSSTTNIKFENTLKEKKGLSILYYLYFYNGGGVATGDINNDGLTDIYFTANLKGANKLYLNKGNFVFEDITEKAGVKGLSDWCSGVTMADVNGDGFLDMYVSTVSNRYGLTGHNELYINNKNNTFSEQSAQFGLNLSCFTTQSAFFDYDQDGDLDCYILNQSHNPHSNIVDTSHRKTYDAFSGDRLYRNDISTTGKFTDVSASAGIYQSNLGYGLGLAISDFNNDGWDDIYVGNDFHENDYYYVNNGNGSFTESGAKHFNHYSRFSMGNDVADYNNDGQLDLITVDMLPDQEKVLKTYGSDENLDIYKVKLSIQGYQNQFSKNALQKNNGNGESFSETSLMSGVAATDWSWSPLFADFDNDGNKDLFISSGIVKRPVDLDYVKFVSALQNQGLNTTDKYDQAAIDSMPDGSSHPFFFKGDGNLKFTDFSDQWGTQKMKGYFTGASYADLDNDGDLDVVINSINSQATVLKNNSTNNNTLTLSFKGEGYNRFGIGVKAYVYAGDKIQYQQLMSTRGFQSSVAPRLHFGLGNTKKIDSILIVWPNQKMEVITNANNKKNIECIQSNAKKDFSYGLYFKPIQSTMIDITHTVGITWKHKENDFIDFNKQYLIPHELSTRGPKLAVGDVNNDGLDDIYACGAAEQSGSLFIQTKSGSFIPSDVSLFQQNAAAEEVDAVFFDANKDGFLDLYVASGGNQFDHEATQYADRFYINDKKGHFKDATFNSLPILLKNKSTISIADVDQDGDIDLFLGGLADPAKYGIPQNSYLLINDGRGVFKEANAGVINLNEIGMVTSSTFEDINKDGWKDLLVTGEWMPIKIFLNNKGSFKSIDIPNSTGIWQTLKAADVNGDGHVDILAGNLGQNSKLWAGKESPLKLYIKDFDKNGSIDQVMTYTLKGKEYTFLAKDELERQLPILKKAYLKYSEVAGKTVQFMFYDLFTDYLELKAEELSSIALINDGKGNFKKSILPDELQLAPVFTFVNQLPGPGYIGMGNLYGVIPYEGRYDALQPSAFQVNKEGKTIAQSSFKLPVRGEVRDAKWLKTLNGNEILVISRNNESLLFFEKNR